MRSFVLLSSLCALLVLALVASPVEGSLRRTGTRSALETQHIDQLHSCGDVRPKGSEQYTCLQQKQWGKCNESWMRGYCQKTCNKCPGSGPAPAPSHPPSAPAHTGVAHNSLAALQINAPASRSAPTRAVSALYQDRKAKILHALRATGMSEPQVRMCLAIAMLETNTFDPNDRDKSKTGDSTNYSQWNINLDMLRRAGVATHGFNEWAGLPNIAAGLKKMIAHYSVNGFLNYLRGGWTGWQDQSSYGCAAYRDGIASMVKMFDTHPELLTNNQRIDMVVAHV